MHDRPVPGRVRENAGTGNSAFESPWSTVGSFRDLNAFNSRATTNYDLPSMNVVGAENAATRSRTPQIINLVGGGTKDISLADEPVSDRGRPRVRLSDRDYADKLRHVAQEEQNVRIKKQNSR